MSVSVSLEPFRSTLQVKKEICYRLLKASPNQRSLPPIKTLAKELRASQVKTHEAVRELVDEGVLVSRPKIGTFINNENSNLFERLQNIVKTSSNKKIDYPFSGRQAVIFRNSEHSPITDAFYNRALKPFTKIAESLGVDLKIEECKPDDPLDLDLYRNADAFIVINTKKDTFLRCGDTQFMLILSTTEHCRFEMCERVDMVCAEDYQAGLIAGKWLLNKNLTDLCFLGVRHHKDEVPFDKTSIFRFKGLQDGLGKIITEERTIVCPCYTTMEGARAVRKWLSMKPRPDTVVAASDDLALGFIHGAEAYHLRAGKDFNIIGFDGQQDAFDPSWGKLTSVAIPMAQMGLQLGKLLEERFREPNLPSRKISMACSMIEGTTTGVNN